MQKFLSTSNQKNPEHRPSDEVTALESNYIQVVDSAAYFLGIAEKNYPPQKSSEERKFNTAPVMKSEVNAPSVSGAFQPRMAAEPAAPAQLDYKNNPLYNPASAEVSAQDADVVAARRGVAEAFNEDLTNA
jgi:hypothetical protein